MKRIPEPELMNEQEQARAYAEADFSEPNQLFLQCFHELCGAQFRGRALDLGCGPADITLTFARAYPGCRIDGLDGAEAMLSFGRAALTADAALKSRVSLICDRLPSGRLAEGGYDAILSNSLLHHLHQPRALWDTVRHCGRPSALVMIMDLFRPDSPAEVDRLVEAYAAQEHAVLQRDFRNSLYAAFTPDEIRVQLDDAGLQALRLSVVSDRHVAVSGRLADG